MSARRLMRPGWSVPAVASKRIRWRWPGLRTTTSTSCSVRGGAPGCWSSRQRTWPERITSSACANSQSAAGLVSPGWAGADSTSSPATSSRPSARRRTSRVGRSMWICSNPSRHSDGTDTAVSTRPSTSASWPWASSRRTPLSSNDGISPWLRASMRSMRTGIPMARVASDSSVGRNSPIRGTMIRLMVPHVSANSSQTVATAQSKTRRKAAAHFKGREGNNSGEFICLQIMTASARRLAACPTPFPNPCLPSSSPPRLPPPAPSRPPPL